MDPLGNVPMFLTALRSVAPERRIKVISRELLIALGIQVLFLFAGRAMLGAVGVSQEALRVSGGVILLLIAVRMIFPSQDANLRENFAGEPFIVPLAVPYVAGPSLLASEILIVSSNPPGMIGWWLLALIVAWSCSAVVLLAAGWLQRFLGEKALTAVERLMGMVLVMISVEMLLTGIKQFLTS